jgi:Lysyl oxidase
MPSRLSVVAVSGLLVVASAASARAAAAAPRALLPDLDQEAPSSLTVTGTQGGGAAHYYLGFGSAVRNIGDGPLIIAGQRRSRGTPKMVANQVIERFGAPRKRVRGVGRMRYVVSPGHRHWHYLGFDHYQLRQAAGNRLRRDRKSGFCLGDRYAVPPPALPSAAPATVFTSRCGLAQPGRTRVGEGISVGFGDYYAANLEGQYVGIDGLPNGQYTLVHRVNADRRLRELRYDNDAASVRLSLHWRGGVPHLRVLASCQDSARCSAPAAARASSRTIAPIPRPDARQLLCSLGAPPARAAAPRWTPGPGRSILRR